MLLLLRLLPDEERVARLEPEEDLLEPLLYDLEPDEEPFVPVLRVRELEEPELLKDDLLGEFLSTVRYVCLCRALPLVLE